MPQGQPFRTGGVMISARVSVIICFADARCALLVILYFTHEGMRLSTFERLNMHRKRPNRNMGGGWKEGKQGSIFC